MTKRLIWLKLVTEKELSRSSRSKKKRRRTCVSKFKLKLNASKKLPYCARSSWRMRRLLNKHKSELKPTCVNREQLRLKLRQKLSNLQLRKKLH